MRVFGNPNAVESIRHFFPSTKSHKNLYLDIMTTILIADDEKDIIDLLKYNLLKEGYAVITARNGAEALDRAQQLPQLILLDVMMPEHNGFEVLKRLRLSERTKHIPVVLLTAKGTEVDEVLGLELGADDYIVKPISIPKLIARVKKALRLHDDTKSLAASVTVGRIEIFPLQHIVKVAGKEVFFPKKEFEVLLFLAQRAGGVINRETLLSAVWGTHVQVIDRTVDVHIRKIREKLGALADSIETIKGVGYRMRESL